jgi:hypothetical protein
MAARLGRRVLAGDRAAAYVAMTRQWVAKERGADSGFLKAEKEERPSGRNARAPVRAPVYDDVEVKLAREIRELAWEMVRLERWAREASNRSQLDREGDLHRQRDVALARRSQLMRELWSRGR